MLIKLLALLLLIGSSFATQSNNDNSSNDKYKIIASGLAHPWSVVFLANDKFLISERNGALVLLDNGNKIPLKLPLKNIYAYGQGGLLDLVKHPNYANNYWIYLSYSTYDDDRDNTSTALARFKIKNNAITNFKILYAAKPYINSSHHFGGRIAFDKDNYLYLSVGDRGKRHLAQNTKTDIGKILRLKDDGTIPPDNPFNNAVFSYGHRNPQGLIWLNDKLIANEHGPRGGDELNYIEKGKNYGWPIITYGKEYISGFSIGEGTHKKGMEQPIHYWIPSIAPSGMAYYDASKFKKWSSSLLIGSLKFRQLVVLHIKNNKVVGEKRLFSDVFGRVRDVRVHNKDIYLLIDSANGSLIKLEPE